METTTTEPTNETRPDRGAVVVRNVGLGFLSQAWFAALAIATTPYIVTSLGVDLYGIYVLVSAVLGYFTFLDLGIGAALTKYVAEYHARDDLPRVGRLIRTALALFLIFGTMGGLVIAGATTFLVDHVLTLEAQDTDLAKAAFLIGALGFVVNLPGQVFFTVPVALQRFDVVVKRTLVLGTASIAGTVAVLALGYGLIAVLLINLSVTVVTTVLFYTRTRALVPGVSFRPRLHRREVRLLLSFGVLRATQRVSTQIVFQLDRFVVAAFLPIAAVAYYAVPLSLSQRVMKLVGNVGVAVFPAASALAGQQDDRRIAELYLRGMKLTALIGLPTSMIMFVYAHEIMLNWLNAEFEVESSTVLMILAAANLLFAFTTVPAVTLDATGRIRASTAFGLLAAGTNVVLVLTLVPTVGVEGAAWAVFGNAAIQVPLLLWYMHTRTLPMGLSALIRVSLARPLAAAGILMPAMVWARSLATNLAALVVLCVVTALVYFGLTIVLRVYDARDRALLRSFLGR
jgi:O-antigen/teichoic acid export membrane protein